MDAEEPRRGDSGNFINGAMVVDLAVRTATEKKQLASDHEYERDLRAQVARLQKRAVAAEQSDKKDLGLYQLAKTAAKVTRESCDRRVRAVESRAKNATSQLHSCFRKSKVRQAQVQAVLKKESAQNGKARDELKRAIASLNHSYAEEGGKAQQLAAALQQAQKAFNLQLEMMQQHARERQDHIAKLQGQFDDERAASRNQSNALRQLNASCSRDRAAAAAKERATLAEEQTLHKQDMEQAKKEAANTKQLRQREQTEASVALSAARADKLATRALLNETLAQLTEAHIKLSSLQAVALKASSSENSTMQVLISTKQQVASLQQAVQAAEKERNDALALASQQQAALDNTSEVNAALSAKARQDGILLGSAKADVSLFNSMQSALNTTHSELVAEQLRSKAREVSLEQELAAAQKKLAEQDHTMQMITGMAQKVAAQEAELKPLRAEVIALRALTAKQSEQLGQSQADFGAANKKIEGMSAVATEHAKEASSMREDILAAGAQSKQEERQLQAAHEAIGAAKVREAELKSTRAALEELQQKEATENDKLTKDDISLAVFQDHVKQLAARVAELQRAAERSEVAQQKANAEELALNKTRMELSFAVASGEAEAAELNTTKHDLKAASDEVSKQAEYLSAIHQQLGVAQGRTKDLGALKDDLAAAQRRLTSEEEQRAAVDKKLSQANLRLKTDETLLNMSHADQSDLKLHAIQDATELQNSREAVSRTNGLLGEVREELRVERSRGKEVAQRMQEDEAQQFKEFAVERASLQAALKSRASQDADELQKSQRAVGQVTGLLNETGQELATLRSNDERDAQRLTADSAQKTKEFVAAQAALEAKLEVRIAQDASELQKSHEALGRANGLLDEMRGELANTNSRDEKEAQRLREDVAQKAKEFAAAEASLQQELKARIARNSDDLQKSQETEDRTEGLLNETRRELAFVKSRDQMEVQRLRQDAAQKAKVVAAAQASLQAELTSRAKDNDELQKSGEAASRAEGLLSATQQELAALKSHDEKEIAATQASLQAELKSHAKDDDELQKSGEAASRAEGLLSATQQELAALKSHDEKEIAAAQASLQAELKARAKDDDELQKSGEAASRAEGLLSATQQELAALKSHDKDAQRLRAEWATQTKEDSIAQASLQAELSSRTGQDAKELKSSHLEVGRVGGLLNETQQELAALRSHDDEEEQRFRAESGQLANKFATAKAALQADMHSVTSEDALELQKSHDAASRATELLKETRQELATLKDRDAVEEQRLQKDSAQKASEFAAAQSTLQAELKQRISQDAGELEKSHEDISRVSGLLNESQREMATLRSNSEKQEERLRDEAARKAKELATEQSLLASERTHAKDEDEQLKGSLKAARSELAKEDTTLQATVAKLGASQAEVGELGAMRGQLKSAQAALASAASQADAEGRRLKTMKEEVSAAEAEARKEQTGNVVFKSRLQSEEQQDAGLKHRLQSEEQKVAHLMSELKHIETKGHAKAQKAHKAQKPTPAAAAPQKGKAQKAQKPTSAAAAPQKGKKLQFLQARTEDKQEVSTSEEAALNADERQELVDARKALRQAAEQTLELYALKRELAAARAHRVG